MNISNTTVLLAENQNQSAEIYNLYFNKSEASHVFVVECVALLGVFVMLTGYKFIRLAMFACGFSLGFFVFYIVSPYVVRTKYCCDERYFQETTTWLTYNRALSLASVAVGVLVGVITTGLYRCGIFFIGKTLGVLFAIIVIHNTTLHQYFDNKLSIVILLTTSAFVFGSLTWRFEKPLLILCTSFLGCYAFLSGIDIFVRSNFSIAVFSILKFLRDAFVLSVKNMRHVEVASVPKLQVNTNHNDASVAMLTSWVFVSLGAAYFQYSVTARNLSQGGKLFPCLSCCPARDRDEKLSK